jgi:uncharacterized membrane protein YebE (DUF533 family)
MNEDEIISLLTKVVLTSSATYLGAHGVDVTQVPGAISGAIAVGSFAFGVYQHWNMKKVPETSVAVQVPGASGTAPSGSGGVAPVGATVTGKVVG